MDQAIEALFHESLKVDYEKLANSGPNARDDTLLLEIDRQEHELRGQFEHAGLYFHKEMVMRRNQLPPYSMKRRKKLLV